MFALFCLSLIAAAATTEHFGPGSACSVTAGEPAGVCSMAATSTLAATKAPVSTLEQEVAGCEPGLVSRSLWRMMDLCVHQLCRICHMK